MDSQLSPREFLKTTGVRTLFALLDRAQLLLKTPNQR
jgi:hypothetical protein